MQWQSLDFGPRANYQVNIKWFEQAESHRRRILLHIRSDECVCYCQFNEPADVQENENYIKHTIIVVIHVMKT